ncbi:MAG TPA: hypothetical protein VJN71_10530, partial [Nitrososphaerales archaeon]|nr:hypothetical protein [Nitrososphaerales archaeon]
QDRIKLEIERTLAPAILSNLANTESEVDLTDGVKIRKGNDSWVLIRSSNTENVIRISAEARTRNKAEDLVHQYSEIIQKLGTDAGTRR